MKIHKMIELDSVLVHVVLASASLMFQTKQWRNKKGGGEGRSTPRRHARGAAFLDKLYVIFLNNHCLFANRKSFYCVAQWPTQNFLKGGANIFL